MTGLYNIPSGPLTLAEISTLLVGPAAIPPPGHVSIFGHHNPRWTGSIVGFVAAHVGCLLAVLARLFTQRTLFKGLVAEDYFACVALIFQIPFSTAGVLNIQSGVGKHTWDLTLKNLIDVERYTFIFVISFSISIAFIKVAIILQFINIFAPRRVNRRLWMVCFVCIIINVIFYAATVIVMIFGCTPVTKIWHPFVEGHCMSRGAMYKATAIFNIISDFTILAIPVPIIWSLRMDIRRKITVLIVFGTGTIACVSSIMRTYYLWKSFEYTDYMYWIWFAGGWCYIEIAAGIFVFCLPVLNRFYHHVKQKMKGNSTSVSPAELRSDSDRPSAPKLTDDMYKMPSLTTFERTKKDSTNKSNSLLSSSVHQLEHSSSDSIQMEFWDRDEECRLSMG